MEMDRRQFIVATAVVGGGFALSIIAPPAESAGLQPMVRVNRMPWLPPAKAASR